MLCTGLCGHQDLCRCENPQLGTPRCRQEGMLFAGAWQAAELCRERRGSTAREMPGPGAVAKPERLQPSSPWLEGAPGHRAFTTAGRSSTGFGAATNGSE